MLAKSQKLLLAQFVKEKQNNCFATLLDNCHKKGKQQAWENILSQINGVGANLDSIKTLQDVIWANIYWGTIKKISESKKIGAGGSGQFSELEEAVLDILWQESANLEPVRVEDSEIVFEKEIVVWLRLEVFVLAILTQSNNIYKLRCPLSPSPEWKVTFNMI